MAIIKCKMCGGDLTLIEGQSVAECEYCGSRQTVPVADNEKKLTLFGRANRLRSACEFDKAAGIYEAIVADFPEEAEAYWGLVLCKYGIEYVDDPATGKKIPTCHRSSFDSVMDDGNFEQAMENADVAALKVYREEAKQIEGIRKGILEVSSNEQPYDIFICYKETDLNGDRTVDSVLAQDIYDALTAKDYRVFFSRITLEDKLGQAYEPYIFAALNSAKIMLAVGTCYEHYNAVWVKNEWSRYLKIIAQDKSKYLIPCYKGLDAYDMPKEFQHLQGQDMGKVGAIQDLLRGVEKILPKRKNTTVVQERVVVGGSGSNKIASLLDRGNMALEDGDWAKADSFFEDVLNNDSKNAQAYLGKTLAQEKCRTIDAFARKRKEATQRVRGETLHLEPNRGHADEIAEQYSIPGYVEPGDICKLYEYDLGYHSDVAERKQQHRNEEAWWANHKQLSRAEKFAEGAVAQNLAAEKKALFAALSDRVKKAEVAENAAKAKVLAAYDAHIAQADEKAQQLYEAGLQRREEHYQNLLQIAKNESNVQKLKEAASAFVAMGAYQDSKNLAEHCRKRATEEQAKINAEAKRRRILAEKAAAEKKKRIKTTISIISAIAVVCIVVAVIVVTVVIPNNRYNAAVALMESGSYNEAIAAFEEMNGYKDSREQIGNIYCLQGIQEMESGNYEDALELFEDASRRVDVSEEMDECYYRMALNQICQWKSGSEWLSQIQTPDVFPDYEDWASLCELYDVMWSVTDDGLENQVEITEFETTLEKIETLVAKLNVDVQLPDSYAELSKNIGYYGKYLTETGEYTKIYSDGSGGWSSAWLSITAYGFRISGLGPNAYLENGEMSVTESGNAYHNSDSYTYTLLEDGRVEVVETDNGRSETHYIIPEE